MEENKYFMYDNKNNEIKEFNENSILDKLYYSEISLPTKSQISEAIKNKIIKLEKNISLEMFLEKLKKNISSIENKCPLYDVYSQNLYLINNYNVYQRVTHNYYRFPEQKFLDELIEYKNKITKTIKNKDELTTRKIRKIDLIEKFLKNFDLDTLYNTYIRIFYKYSDFLGKEITFCKRKSFLPYFYHILPYYTKSEITNMALNLNIDITNKSTDDLCKIINKNEISAKMLLKHQEYMVKHSYVSAMQYYTLQGSYFMNTYLRNQSALKNKILEELIKPLWSLINNSPEFDNDYTFYRFVNSDSHLSHLKVGDIYTETGFMSTTRDPFYRADLYGFGFILMKINIPKNIKGVALCVETLSQFPKEQEIIFSPNSKFKLIKKDNNVNYYHTDKKVLSNIKTRYEFDYVENEKPNFNKKDIDIETYSIDFIKDIKNNKTNFDRKIDLFKRNYVNEINQFKSKIGNEEITLIYEEFDSTGAYKKFYGLEIKNGYSFYYIKNAHPIFFIEIGEKNNHLEMHVNFHVKYSMVNLYKYFNENDFIKFISSIAYHFDIPSVIIYADYLTCDDTNKNNINLVQHGGSIQRKYNNIMNDNDTNQLITNIYGGNYCVDIYEYMKNKNKKFIKSNILEIELKPLFSYYDIDILETISADKIIDKNDNDEIYQVYDKIYKNMKNKNTITDFYLWIKENKCYLLKNYSEKISRILKNKNPFLNDAYILDPGCYLYNRKLISIYPNYIGTNIENKKRNTEIIDRVN